MADSKTHAKRGALATPEAVRAHYKEPDKISAAKEIHRLDRHCAQFIAASPFLVIASSDAHGRADATPRGDAPGFVAVLDDRTILIPDRRGNNRVDTMMNIAENPHVGLLFLVPGKLETLRVNGRATITIDGEILERLAADGKAARAAIRVEIEEIYFQCGKAMIRSELWNPARHVAKDAFPLFGKVLAEHCQVGYDGGLDDLIDEEYRNGLY